ncbi:hypothetical protein LBYZC6_50820 [Lacrimispora brassicae]
MLYDRRQLTERSSFYVIGNSAKINKKAAAAGGSPATAGFCNNIKTNVKKAKDNNFILTRPIKKAKEK